MIGDTHTAALVGRNGSIDWLCLPRFDSGACFAALLGDETRGRWLLSPTGTFRTRRRYRADTLVLETEHETDTGSVHVTDFMTPRRARPGVIRIVRGIAWATSRCARSCSCASITGSAVPWLRQGRRSVTAVAGPDAVELRTDAPLDVVTGNVTSDFRIAAGDRVAFTMTWHRSFEPPPPPIDPGALKSTIRYWNDWTARCTYQGEWREAVNRSLLTLKALSYRPTGGIVAAPTTSLPEELGGARNWDYRFCWLRDATFTLYAMLMAGYEDEAEAWRDWLLRAVAGDPRDLQSCTASPASDGCRSSRWSGCPATRIRSRFGSGTTPRGSSSSTSTARSWTPLTRPRAWGIPVDEAAWAFERR